MRLAKIRYTLKKFLVEMHRDRKEHESTFLGWHCLKETKAKGVNMIRYSSNPSCKRWKLGTGCVDPCSCYS